MSEDIRVDHGATLGAPALADWVARAGEPLIEGDDFFRELVNALPAAIYTTDHKGRITYYNEAAAALWGCRPELGKSEWCGSWKIFWPDGRPLPHDQCPMALAIKERRPIRGIDAIAERPDGTRVPFLPFPTPIYDRTGALIGAVNLLVDITALKESQANVLRRADEQAALYQFTDQLYRAASLAEIHDAAFDAMERALGCRRAAILMFDDSGVMRFVGSRGLSKGYCEAVEGHTPWKKGQAEADPVCVEDIDAADESPTVKAAVKAEGIGALAFIPLVSDDGVVGKFMTYYDAPHRFDQSEMQLALAIARQISFALESRGVRKARDAVGHRYAAVVESSDDAIVTKDLNGIITTWNGGAERLFGYMAEEAIGKPVIILIPQDRRQEEDRIIERIRRGQRVEHYETIRQRKNGSLVDISLTVSPIKDAEGKIVGASKIARDITARKRSEMQIETLAREAEHRAKNILARVMATVHLSQADSAEALKKAIAGRVNAMAKVHSLFVESRWSGADLRTLLTQELAPYRDVDEGRVVIDGPSLWLQPDAAQAMAVAVYELATNAAKYGALSSSPEGCIRVEWSDWRDGALVVRWTETGGPPATPPTREGFGTRMLGRVMRDQQHGDIAFDWRETGLICEMTLHRGVG